MNVISHCLRLHFLYMQYSDTINYFTVIQKHKTPGMVINSIPQPAWQCIVHQHDINYENHKI